MKKFFAFVFCLALELCINTGVNSRLYAADALSVSGLFDSTLRLGEGGEGGFLYGIEEYANIRLRGRIGGAAVFYGAFNCIAASGISAAAMAADMLSPPSLYSASGQNYAAAIELERLYFHIANEKTGFDAGLMRIAFGYGNAFSPSDFFNPRNPLYPDARPRAILGGLFSFYPDDDSTLRTFAAAQSNPLSNDGGGFKTGLSGERHFKKLSVQGLYAFESPRGAAVAVYDAPDGAPSGVHYFGASLKGDAFAGFWLDMLYALNPARGGGSRELSASAGFDYSLAPAHLYFLCEYLFNGAYSVTADIYKNNHYLYGLARYNVSDFTSVSLAAIFGVDDASFTPALSFTTNLFQGMTLTLSAQTPLDRAVFTDDSGDSGELGPVQSGARFLLAVKAELRF
ncbi:MAG: hypothetical protein LBB47_06615 [Spirochaetaceae bacterium]|jgi:hypothetical protein|nr:hypothetical protein [Spirochaetaceae bacterium]